MPPVPYIEKTGFHRVHRTLVSTRPERLVNGSYEDAGVDLRPNAGSLCDQTLVGCVWSCRCGSVEETMSDWTLGESSRA